MSEDVYKLVTVLGEETEVTEEIKIGRSKSCQIFLQDAEVSRHHATVWAEGEKLFIRDEGSSNGTFINDEQVEGTQELKDRDKIRAGNMVIIVRAPYTEAVTMMAPEPEPAPEPKAKPKPAPKAEPKPKPAAPPEPVKESAPMMDEAPEEQSNLLRVGLIVGGCLVVLCITVACIAAAYAYFTTGGFNF